ncbi:MAG: NAD-dependent epimerase/dehydratase family protein [Pseudomonadota bacterium]
MDLAEKLRGEKVLVTGGAGFVGSNIVKRLLDLQADVTVLDDFSTGREDNLPSAHRNMEVVRGDVTNYKLIRDLAAQARYVCHCAARNIIASTRNPREDFEVNMGGTLNLLLAMRELGGKHMVNTSSCSVYGNPRYLPINEDDTVNVLSPYSVSKLAGENYCKAFYETYGVSAAVVRYSNVYGVGQRVENPYCGVVAKFFDSATSGKSPQIHGDGEQTRDFTYVDDAVEATLVVLCSPKSEGQVYNVATGREMTVNELARLIIRLVGTNVEPVHIDHRDIDNIRRRALNIEKIRRELRWTPSVTVEEGLKKTHAWIVSRGGNT